MKIPHFFLLCFFPVFLSAQDNAPLRLPEIELTTENGEAYNASNISNTDKPVLIFFWATWCSPCRQELSAVSDLYTQWQNETGVKIVLVSIDANYRKAKRYMENKGWKFDSYYDPGQNLKKAMNVKGIPHVILLDRGGNIAWQHSSYYNGLEQKIYEEVKKLLPVKPENSGVEIIVETGISE